MANFYLKKGDTSDSLVATLRDANGVVVNLTGATVKFSMMDSTGTVHVSLASVTVTTAAAGLVTYSWVAGDVDTAGTFRGEFQVTYSGGGIQTFPNDSYIIIEITADVA